METDGENRSQMGMGPKHVVQLDIEFLKRKGIPPPQDPDEQEYMEHLALWEAILGVHPYSWSWDKINRVPECNRSLVDDAFKNAAKYTKESQDYYKKTEPNDGESVWFTPVEILPRSPYPRCFHTWHRNFRMTNTNPTSVGSMRFTQPGATEYASSELFQFFSMRFAGEFSHGQRMSIYGFVAVRDEVDALRNYIFNCSREHAQEITADSPDLSLIPPARGISAPFHVIVEYSLKVKGNGNGSDETKCDEVLIDGCFMFKDYTRYDCAKRIVRLFGPLGPLDIRFAFMRYAVEATIQVKVKRAMPGYNLSRVTALTCGYKDEITLYDRSAALKEEGGGLSQSVLVVANAVVAVELGCNLRLRFEVITREEECEARKSSHELSFTAQRYMSSKGAMVMGKMLKVASKVTWSTMGEPFLARFDTTKQGLLGSQDGPCRM